MSVLLEFAMFPTDKTGDSASESVSKVIDMINKSGVKYKLTAMGTIIETETLQEALDIVRRNTKRLDNIIVDFLDVSRIDAARVKFRFLKKDLLRERVFLEDIEL